MALLTRGTMGALTLLGLATLAPKAQAQDIVYDNGTFTSAVAGANMTGRAAADDFTLTAPTSFNAIRFWAADTRPGLLSVFSGNVTWYIYEGSAGAASPNAIPSTTILSQGTVSGTDITITDTGSLLNGNPNFAIAQLDCFIPIQNLAPGTYWLRLKDGTPTSTPPPVGGIFIIWMRMGASTGSGFRLDQDPVNPTTWDSSGTNTSSDFTFQLVSSTAPEPGTLALVALGIVGGGVVRRRRPRFVEL